MNPLRIVQFPEAGEGFELFFRNPDFRALFNEYGDEYMNVVPTALLKFDINMIDRLLGIAAKKKGDPHKLKFDDLDEVSLETLQGKLLDAWSLSMSGRDWLAQQEFLIKEAKKFADKVGDASPLKPLGDLSANSSAQHSGPASPPATSGG